MSNKDHESDNDSNNESENDSNDESNNEKEEYINVSYIIEEMESVKDELKTTRTLLENTILLVEVLNYELIKKHHYIKHLKNHIIKEEYHKIGKNNEENKEDNNEEEKN